MNKADCQPPWRMSTIENMPICDNWTQLMNYKKEYDKVWHMFRDEVIEYTKCLFPCTFMEYRLTEDPIKMPSNDTTLMPMYESNIIHIHKEEEAFSFGSLV